MRTVGRGRPMSTAEPQPPALPPRPHSTAGGANNSTYDGIVPGHRHLRSYSVGDVDMNEVTAMRRRLRRRSRRWSSGSWSSTLPVILEEFGEDDDERSDKSEAETSNVGSTPMEANLDTSVVQK